MRFLPLQPLLKPALKPALPAAANIISLGTITHAINMTMQNRRRIKVKGAAQHHTTSRYLAPHECTQLTCCKACSACGGSCGCRDWPPGHGAGLSLAWTGEAVLFSPRAVSELRRWRRRLLPLPCKRAIAGQRHRLHPQEEPCLLRKQRFQIDSTESHVTHVRPLEPKMVPCPRDGRLE